MAKFHALKVADIRRETAEAVSVAFEVPAPLQPEYLFKHGQYITLKLKVNGEELRRSYSLCTSPYAENELRVAVKEVQNGRGSTYINRQLKKGDVVEVMTPMGNFTTPLSGSAKKNYVLFAGGSGITPMMSILKSVLHIEKNSHVTLIYANRNEQSVIFKEALDKLSAANSQHLKLVYVYDECADAGIPDLQKGLLTKEKTKTLLENYGGLTADEYFICGPGPLMESIKEGLKELKIAENKIHIEYFSAVLDTIAKAESGGGESIESDVTILQYGMETKFKLKSDGATVLDAALDAGVDVPFSCKGAVCCTCRAKVLEGKVKMDANFALTDGEVAQGFILTCQAHPLTDKVVIDYDAM